MTILPWRPTEGRVMQFFCDVEKPDGDPFGGNCRGFLREMNRRFRKLDVYKRQKVNRNREGPPAYCTQAVFFVPVQRAGRAARSCTQTVS